MSTDIAYDMSAIETALLFQFDFLQLRQISSKENIDRNEVNLS